MNKVLVIFLICTVFHNIKCNQDADIQTVEADNVKSVLENAFEQAVLSIITTRSNLKISVSNAEVQLQNFQTQLDSMIKVVKANDKEKFQNIVDEAKTRIQQWQLIGQEHKTNIHECVHPNEKVLDDLLKNLIVEDFGCIDKEHQFELNNITQAREFIQDVVETFEGFGVESVLKGCMDEKSLSCINEFKIEISKLSTSLPAEITRRIQEVMILMNETPVRLQECSVKYLDAVKEQTENVVEVVSNCAKKIIGLEQ